MYILISGKPLRKLCEAIYLKYYKQIQSSFPKSIQVSHRKVKNEPGDLRWETPAVSREKGGGLCFPGLSLTDHCPDSLPGRKLLRPETQWKKLHSAWGEVLLGEWGHYCQVRNRRKTEATEKKADLGPSLLIIKSKSLNILIKKQRWKNGSKNYRTIFCLQETYFKYNRKVGWKRMEKRYTIQTLIKPKSRKSYIYEDFKTKKFLETKRDIT